MPSPLEIKQERDKHFERMKECYERVFGSTDGQKILEDIAISGGIKRSAFNTDALIMAANVAKQDFANHIIEMATKNDKKKQSQEAIK